MAYYLLYRSQKVADLDIKEVREVLTKVLSQKNVPHAYLFAGPKGTGKTSAARIIAKSVNCTKKGKSFEPCNRCENCKSITNGSNIDIIEIDAASHRGIDDVRAIKDAAKLATASLLKKVYIIDEAHMLTTEASNALLKILEEPPSHVIFILATTNPEKLIGTIKSRTTVINFRKANQSEIMRSLTRIVKGEKIKADEEDLATIAELADGSFRDAAKLLEQSVVKNKLDKSLLSNFYYGKAQTLDFIGYLIKKDTSKALIELHAINNQMGSLTPFVKELLNTLRQALLACFGLSDQAIEGLTKNELIELIELFDDAFVSMKSSYEEIIPFEIASVRWCESDLEKSNVSNLMRKTDSLKKKPLNNDFKNITVKNGRDEKLASLSSTINDRPILDTSYQGQMTDTIIRQVDESIWNQLLSRMNDRQKSTEALLRAAKPVDFDGTELTVGVFYSFHKEKLEENIHRTAIEDVCGDLMGTKVRLKCILTRPDPKIIDNTKTDEAVLTESKNDDIVKVAEEIFNI